MPCAALKCFFLVFRGPTPPHDGMIAPHTRERTKAPPTMAAASSRYIGKKSPKDWEESYYALEQRYLSLQKDHQRKEQEWKLHQVAERRGKKDGGGPTAAVAHPTPLDISMISAARSTAAPPRPATAGAYPPRSTASLPPAAASSATTPMVPVTSSSTAAPANGSPLSASAAAGATRKPPPPARRDSATSPKTATPPVSTAAPTTTAPHEFSEQALSADPRMIWGAEKTVEHFIQVSQLYEATEMLRRKLEDADAASKLQQHEIAQLRQAVASAHSRGDDLHLQLNRVVQERDMAAQRLVAASQTTQQLEQAMATQLAERERMRSVFEGQLQDLRTRLLVSADGNETLGRDVRGLLSELKEKTAAIAGLQSRLTLTENQLVGQRNTNQSLLVELKSLNDQLTSERKRSLMVSREAQVAGMSRARVEQLEAQIDQLVQQRTAMEQQHVRMLDDFVRVSTEASNRAHEDVKDELQYFRVSADHWERVAQMMYQDIVQRTQAHIACREECEEAKHARDEASLAVRALRDELRLVNAKLNIVWPTHRTDTADMDADRITKTFQRLGRFSAAAGLASQGQRDAARRQRDEAMDEVYVAAGLPPPSQEDLVRELEEANIALTAELEAQRVVNELLSEQLRNRAEAADAERRQYEAAVEDIAGELEFGHRLMEKRDARVDFLERQIASMRGQEIAANTALEVGLTSDAENILELFVGQLLRVGVPSTNNYDGALLPPSLFCTVDFLVHETTATRVVHGWSGFLDTTIAFRVAMDSLLVHYLTTRGVMIQLHRLATSTTTANSSALSSSTAPAGYETIAEGFAPIWELLQRHSEDPRPTLRGSVNLFNIASNHEHGWSVEFVLTARAPFSQHMKQLIATVNFQRLLLEESGGAALAAHNAGQRVSTMPQWRRAMHDADGSVLARADEISSQMESQPSAGPSVSVAKVQEAPSHPLVNRSLFLFQPRETFVPVAAISLWVDTVKVNLNLDHLPHLSCCFALPALHQDVFIPPAGIPTYEWNVRSMYSFPLTSMREVFRLVRDPLALFFFDEGDANRRHYWATCAADLGPCLMAPGECQRVTLTLTSYEGHAVGAVEVRLESTPARVAAPESEAIGVAAAQADVSLDAQMLAEQYGPSVLALPAVIPPQNSQPPPTLPSRSTA